MATNRNAVVLSALGLTALLASGCAAAHGSTARSAEPTPNLHYLKKSISEYHDSGRWDADIARADQRAREYLERRLAEGVPNPAIVLDIDETSLSTYGYEAEHDFGYMPEEFDRYVLDRAPTAIPATRDLVGYAHSRGVAVFFVTGRREDPRMREATAQDLREEGYPQPAGLFLRPEGDHDPSVVPYKSGAREGIEQQGYRIVLNVGDQDADLAGGHAERGVKLPNPIYRTP
ncbi:5'-nucleotidase (lipoprotein e(P4) family) [Saccharopolyspora erythraea NRRL 2338]|uniref:Acid phosphatase, class B n=2 Tax=Saccharopolyspora erythraea TaxID=1836 RepID=A4FEN5_SACEN|nr:HAD family acid phosphatase [Saccharopolyspora erythraea]PFG96235.1 5'-nucleotidase (lipoprotein e(P4) family) [Saccharopolyspora erythraea NRRL 2338]QRK92762.1 HAD family acid phosphatase [Saccharopolyspora erythraea]CAM02510.1 acid phosphatase, class B [Saccharopolyspora erythraea NRRL 2338]